MNLKDTISRDLVMLWFLMGQHRGRGRGGDFGHPAPLDPTRGRGRIIAMLKIKDGLSAKELAQVLGIRVSSLNETLAKMEKDGLVERKPSDADKRVVLIYLTEAGHATEIEERDEADMLDGFSDEELEQLSGYVSRMLKNVEGELDEDLVANMRAEWDARERLFSATDAGFDRGPRPRWGGMPGGFDPRMGMMR